MREGTWDAFGAAAMVYFILPKARLRSDVPGAEPKLLKMSRFFQNYEDFSSEHKEVLKFAAGRVLDVGCGAGRFLIIPSAVWVGSRRH